MWSSECKVGRVVVVLTSLVRSRLSGLAARDPSQHTSHHSSIPSNGQDDSNAGVTNGGRGMKQCIVI